MKVRPVKIKAVVNQTLVPTLTRPGWSNHCAN